MSSVITAVVVAAAATTYSVSENEQAKRLAGQEKNRQKSDFDAAQKKLKEREANERAMELSKAKRDRVISAGNTASTKGGTILTSPLGVSAPPSTGARKTLLGE